MDGKYVVCKIELDGAAELEKNADIIVNNWNGIVR